MTAVIAQLIARVRCGSSGWGCSPGSLLVAFLVVGVDETLPTADQFLFLGGYTAAMTVVCMIACVVPTRRALSVQPTEALRES